jgi:hypothetical protein
MNDKTLPLPEEVQHAFNLYQYIQDIKARSTADALSLGMVFDEIKTNKLYELLGDESFEELVAHSEVGYMRAKALQYINVWKKFKNVLDKERLMRVGYSRLAILAPIVLPETMDDWLDKADTYSWSDFLNEVRVSRGGSPMVPRKKVKVIPHGRYTPEEYIDLVRHSPCLVPDCHNQATPHHFPTTRGAGAKPHEAVPLCLMHHSEYQEHPTKFLWDNIKEIMDWMFNVMVDEGREDE